LNRDESFETPYPYAPTSFEGASGAEVTPGDMAQSFGDISLTAGGAHEDAQGYSAYPEAASIHAQPSVDPGAFYEQSMDQYYIQPAPSQPLRYHLYVPPLPYAPNLQPHQRSIHSFFLADDIRENLTRKNEMVFRILDPECKVLQRAHPATIVLTLFDSAGGKSTSL
jgi:hypothetical protein